MYIDLSLATSHNNSNGLGNEVLYYPLVMNFNKYNFTFQTGGELWEEYS